jgi:biopolymer transport protein ExbD
MALREKKELNGEMGMSSMTDIIFILLIFFMMVSTMVHPSALNLSLPGNSKTTKKPISTDKLDDVGISASGNFLLNGSTMDIGRIRRFLETNKAKNPNFKVSVSPDGKAPVEKVVQVLDMTESLTITSILHADTN